MKKAFAYLLLSINLIYGLQSIAQNPKVDSLLLVLKSASHDTTRATIYIALTEEFYVTKKDTVIPLCLKALKIINASINKSNTLEKRSFKRSMSQAYNNIGVVSDDLGDVTTGFEYYKKSLAIEEELGNKQGIAVCLGNIGSIYVNKADYPMALKYFYKALKIQEEIVDKQSMSATLNNIGIVYLTQGNTKRALEAYEKSLKLKKESGNKPGIAHLLNNIGAIYDHQGDVNRALEYYHQSLKLNEELGDKNGVAHAEGSIGEIYSGLGNDDKAMKCFKRSLEIYEKSGEKRGEGNALINVGDIYRNQEKYELALEYYNRSLKITEEIDNKKMRSHVLMHIAEVLKHKGELIKALEYMQEALKIQEANGDKHSVSYALRGMGSIYYSQAVDSLTTNKANQTERKKLLDMAEDFGLRSLKITRSLGYPDDISASAGLLYRVYKKEKKFKLALEMHQLYKLMADSLNNITTRKSGLKKQLEYDYEKKENAAKALQTKKDIIALEEMKIQKVVRNSFIIGFALVLIMALLIVRGYKQKQRTNIEILAQKAIIEEKQNEILDSIHYAKRIQTALITSEKYIDKNLEKLIKNS